MSINARCPHCNAIVKAPDEMEGRNVRCPRPTCGKTFQVTASSPATQSTPPPRSTATRQAPPPPSPPRRQSRESFEDLDDSGDDRNSPPSRGQPNRQAHDPSPQGIPVVVNIGGASGPQMGQQPGGAGLAITGMVLGIVGLVFCFFPCIGWLLGPTLGVLGTIFSGIGLAFASKTGRGKGMSIAGLATSVLAIVFYPLLWFVIVGSLFSAVKSIPIPPPNNGPVVPFTPPGMQNQPPRKNGFDPIKGRGEIPDPRAGTLLLVFAPGQRFEGLEVFLDGKLIPRDASQVPAGQHLVAVQLDGNEEFSQQVDVKPADQGVTRVPVPPIERVGPGTLQITLVCTAPGWKRNLELFVDGNLSAPRWHYDTNVQYHPLVPGQHTIAFKKNSVEVYSQQVEVKKPSDGRTYLKIDLEVGGTVRLENRVPIGVGVDAFVDVDGENRKRWPVGSTSLEVWAEVGKRVIRVYTTKPIDRVHLKTDVDVKPGKQEIVRVN